MTTIATRLVRPAVALFCAFAASVAAAETLPAPAVEPFTLKELSPGVWAALDREGKAGANAGFIIGDDGVAIVDSFYNPDAARALLADIRKLTPLPIRYVINTHYHIDHVAGDDIFRQAGAIIVAQRNVHAWIRTENLKFYGSDPKPEQRAMVEGLDLPDIGVDRELTLWLGKRRVELKAWPGHTGGDLVVKVNDAKVLFCGDLLWRRTAPNLIDATVAQWIGTLSSLQRAPQAAEWTYVPGHGSVAGLADVGDFRGYLKDVTSIVAAKVKTGAKGDDLVKASVAALSPKYGTWDFFARGAPREIGFVAVELGGTKRTPPPSAPEPW